MALDSRLKVFLPWFTATAGGLFLLTVPLMVYAQRAKTGTQTTLRIDKAVRFVFGLASCVQVCAVVMLFSGRQGILLAAQYLGDGSKVEAEQIMLGTHVALLVFYAILFLINWFVTSDRGAGLSIQRFFFARHDYGQAYGGQTYGEQACVDPSMMAATYEQPMCWLT